MSMIFSNPIRPPVAILKNDKFGMRTLGGKQSFHNGVDLRPQSDDILASHEGVVSFAGLDQFGALWIQIDNGNQRTRYVHNRRNLVATGQKVSRGQLIGKIGSTGRSTGRHLHFETWTFGIRVDPERTNDFKHQPFSQPAPTPPPAPKPPTVINSAPKFFRYKVKPGDTLSGIVAKHYNLKVWTQIKAKYEEVARYNLIPNPNQIFVNQIIKLP